MSDGCGDTRSDIEERSWVLFGLIYGGTTELDNYPNEIINDDVQRRAGNPPAQLERHKTASEAFAAQRAGRKLVLARAGRETGRERRETRRELPNDRMFIPHLVFFSY